MIKQLPGINSCVTEVIRGLEFLIVVYEYFFYIVTFVMTLKSVNLCMVSYLCHLKGVELVCYSAYGASLIDQRVNPHALVILSL